MILQKKLSGEKENIFLLLKLSGPSIAEQLLQTAVNYIDAAMVGSLGAAATAAVAINSPPIWLISGLFQGLGVGFSVQAAHFIGAREKDKTKSVIRQGILTTIIFGLIIMAICLNISPRIPLWMGADAEILPDAVDYIATLSAALPFAALQVVLSFLLRCMGDTKTPLLSGIFSNCINVILNTLLIFETRSLIIFGKKFTIIGFGMGVKGAAAATAIATIAASLFLMRKIFSRKNIYRISIKEKFLPENGIIRKAFKLGVPVSLDRMILNIGQLVMIRTVSGLGTISLAANHVAITAESFCYLPAYGISYSATALVGQSIGAKEYERARSFGHLSAVLGFSFMAVVSFVMFIFARPLSSIFTPDAEVIRLSANVIRIVSVAEPFFGLSIILSGVLRGSGDTKTPFYISIAGMWGLRISLMHLFTNIMGAGIYGVWLAMSIDLIFRGIVGFVIIRRGKWILTKS